MASNKETRPNSKKETIHCATLTTLKERRLPGGLRGMGILPGLNHPVKDWKRVANILKLKTGFVDGRQEGKKTGKEYRLITEKVFMFVVEEKDRRVYRLGGQKKR